MKTKKLLLAIMLIGLGTLSSCGGISEDDAKTLIRVKVPNCKNVTKIDEGYIAVDSGYNIYVFDENGAAVKP